MWKFKWNRDPEWIKKNEKWLFLLIGGIILLLLAFPSGSGSDKEPTSAGSYGGSDVFSGESGAETEKAGEQAEAQRRYEKEMEQRVREILENVEGVGKVDVMITLRSTSEKVIHVDQEKSRSSTDETDSAGGVRRQMQEEIRDEALTSGDGQPVVEKELEPEILGVVISAEGGGNASVCQEISEAMQALFGVPAHKIKVLKRVE